MVAQMYAFDYCARLSYAALFAGCKLGSECEMFRGQA
jgi:hypothetical protein